MSCSRTPRSSISEFQALSPDPQSLADNHERAGATPQATHHVSHKLHKAVVHVAALAFILVTDVDSATRFRSCSVCRRRKTRCNRQSPCSNCVRSRRKEACIYDQEPQPVRPRPRSIQPDISQAPVQALRVVDAHVSAGLAASTTPAVTYPDSTATIVAEPASPTTDATQVSPRNIDLMQSRIKHLEQQLYKAVSQSTAAAPVVTPASDIETTSSKFAGTFHVHGSSTLFGSPALMSRSISHKTRLLGQSHWMNGAVPVVSDCSSVLTTHLLLHDLTALD